MRHAKKRGGDGLYRHPGSSNWWMSVMVGGKRRRKSTGTDDYQEAKRIRAQTAGDVAAGRPVPLLTKVTFAEGRDLIRADYATRERRSAKSTLEPTLKRLGEFFKDSHPLASIGWGDALRYRQWRQEQGMTVATINRHLAALKHILRLAHKAGKLGAIPPIELPDPQNARQGFVRWLELKRIARNLPTSYKALAWAAFLMGWRIRSELLPLAWSQVDFAAGTVRLEVHTTKTGRGRMFPFMADRRLRAVFRMMRRRANTQIQATGGRVPLVFHDAGQATCYTAFLEAWRRACDAAGLAGLIPHDLRRSAAM